MVSMGQKDRIVRSFKERTFQAGQRLLIEGQPSSLCQAFVIKEGHVHMMSRLNPNDVEFDDEGRLVGTRPSKSKGTASGYLSKTVQTFQFGIKGKHSWVGEDILLMQTMDPIFYSAVAIGKVVALEISKNDILSKMPVPFIKNLEKASLRRRDFFRERLLDTKKVVQDLIKKSEEVDAFESEQEKREYMQYKSLLI